MYAEQVAGGVTGQLLGVGLGNWICDFENGFRVSDLGFGDDRRARNGPRLGGRGHSRDMMRGAARWRKGMRPPVLGFRVQGLGWGYGLQGYLARTKQRPPRTLQ